jgi:hypothetical protein
MMPRMRLFVTTTHLSAASRATESRPCNHRIWQFSLNLSSLSFSAVQEMRNINPWCGGCACSPISIIHLRNYWPDFDRNLYSWGVNLVHMDPINRCFIRSSNRNSIIFSKMAQHESIDAGYRIQMLLKFTNFIWNIFSTSRIFREIIYSCIPN